MSRTNPYTTLLQEFREYARDVKYRPKILMWVYDESRLSEGWSLSGLAERVAAADQLGHDVLLRNTERGLEVVYVKRAPEAPWRVRA